MLFPSAILAPNAASERLMHRNKDFITERRNSNGEIIDLQQRMEQELRT